MLRRVWDAQRSMIWQIGGRRQRSQKSYIILSTLVSCALSTEPTYVPTVYLRTDSPPPLRDRLHLRIRLKVRRRRRLGRIAGDCAARCICDTHRVQHAASIVVSLCRGSVQAEDEPSCKDEGPRGSLGRWRAHIAICASDLVCSLRKTNRLLRGPL